MSRASRIRDQPTAVQSPQVEDSVPSAQLFRPPPPQTPNPSSLSTSSTYSSSTAGYNASRKRHRPMPSASGYALSSYSSATTPGGWSHISVDSIMGSPPPMVNTNYTLAGGMDTPSLLAEKRYDHIDFDQYGRFQRDWNVDDSEQPMPTTSLVGGDGNGRARTVPNEAPKSSWGSFVLGVVGGAVGGVVGGVWAFCRDSAFRGFHAGGGQGYELRRSAATDGDEALNEKMWEDEAPSFRFDRLSTPVPGEYPIDDEDDEEQLEEDDDHRARPAKRLQTDGGGWIMVSTKDDRHRDSSPRRRLSLTPSHAPRLHQSRSSSTSYSRRSLVPVSRARHRMSAGSYSGSPGPSANRRISLEPQANSPATNTAAPTKKTSPLSAEAHRFAAKKRRQERVAEERFERVNDRLKEMIREGKEALGSKVEVVDEDMRMW